MIGDNNQWSVRPEVVIKEGVVDGYFYMLENASDWEVDKISQNPSQLDPKQAPGGCFDAWRGVNRRLSL